MRKDADWNEIMPYLINRASQQGGGFDMSFHYISKGQFSLVNNMIFNRMTEESLRKGIIEMIRKEENEKTSEKVRI